MEAIFRLAAQSDLDSILHLMREYYAFDGHHFDELQSPAALQELLSSPSLGRVWLICDSDTVVGYIVLAFGYSLEYLGRDAFVDEFFIRESCRGRGWGRRALELVERDARSFQVRALHLEVTKPNARARQLYQKLGFEDHEHHLMTKRLDR